MYGWKIIFQAKRTKKQAGIDILISNKWTSVGKVAGNAESSSRGKLSAVAVTTVAR